MPDVFALVHRIRSLKPATKAALSRGEDTETYVSTWVNWVLNQFMGSANEEEECDWAKSWRACHDAFMLATQQQKAQLSGRPAASKAKAK